MALFKAKPLLSGNPAAGRPGGAALCVFHVSLSGGGGGREDYDDVAETPGRYNINYFFEVHVTSSPQLFLQQSYHFS